MVRSDFNEVATLIYHHLLDKKIFVREYCWMILKLCAIQVLEGVFPGHVEDGKTMPTCYAKWDGNTEGDVNTLVLPTHLSTDTSGKACPPIQGRH